jgi:diguanylate cyclase (GGDEF)-like protein
MHQPAQAMSITDNPWVTFVRRAIILSGGLLLVAAVYQLNRQLPDLRYVALFTLALILSWPRLQLPLNAAELLFYLVLLIYGSPSAILLSLMVTVVMFRSLLEHNRTLFFLRCGQSVVSAALAAVVLHWLLSISAEAHSPLLLINALAWMAWTRYLFHVDWLAFFATIRSHKFREKFVEGQWINGFVAYFAAAITAGVVLLVAQHNESYISVLCLVILTIFYFAFRRFKKRYIDSEEVTKLHLRTMEALAGAIEAKDHRAQSHAQRLQFYTDGLGKALGLSEPELKGLRAATLLRDIGKLAVPDYILNKSDNLTEAELEKMKLHPVVGANILEQVGFPYPLVPAVKHHHEHWDGSGYPDQLRGEAIPVTARILAIVDAFDAVYGDGANPAHQAEAIHLLQKESGRLYDPEIVHTFLEKLPLFEAEIRELKTSEQAGIKLRTAALPMLPPAEDPARALAEIRRAHQEGTELLYLAQTLSSTLNLEEAVAIIISRISRLITFDTGAIYLCDETGMTAYVAGAVGVYADKLRGHEALVGHGTIGAALSTEQPTYSSEPGLEFVELEEDVQTVFRSMTVHPLVKANRVIGAIVLLSTEPNSFTNEHQRVMAMVEPLAADALFNSMTYLRTEARALTDALTGLPNSRALVTYFEQESNRAERYVTTLAMLMIDLDGFKQVNDTYGHQSGDLVLREVANCLKNELRAGDPLIRYAGDEFIVLLPYAEESSINDLITRIQKRLEAHTITVNGAAVRVGASIGYAMYNRDGRTLDELMKVADEGMYRNKALRKRPVRPRLVPASMSQNADEIGIIYTKALAS